MLGGLGGVDEGGIQYHFVGDLAGDLVGFLDDAIDRRAIDRLHRGTMHLEHLLQALHMRLGFIEVSQKSLLELFVGGLFRHFRKRFHQLLLGIIDVLQLMHEQVVHGLDVFGEESHCGRPSFGEHAGAGLYVGRTRALHVRC